MRIVLTGGTGVIGRAALTALSDAGHDVVVCARQPGNHDTAAAYGVASVDADIFDAASLEAAYDGADAVINLASHVPIGYLGVLARSWRQHDQLHLEGVANVVAAARAAGVRRVVQASVTSLYADQGDDWITESSPLGIGECDEPVAVAESHVQGYTCESRTGVVLRFGQIVGDDPMTRYWLKAAANGRPVGVGRPEQWAHLIHTDDLGSAVLSSLVAPHGCYNVGATPVLKRDLVAAYAEAADVDEVGFLGPLLRRMAGPRIEPIATSLRVCSEKFSAAAGWRASRPEVDASWIESAAMVGV